MKIRCDRSELGETLNALLGIVPSTQTTKPVLLNFFLWTADGRLNVEAMDLDIGSRINVEHVEVMEDGQLALPASRLAALVRELPDKCINIESIERDKESSSHGAFLRAEGYDLKILGDDPAEFPRVPSFSEEGSCRVDRDAFTETLRRVAIASSRDPARYQLTGVFIELEDDRLTLTATDGKRLTNDSIRIENPASAAISGIVPNRAVDTILKVVPQGEPEFSLVVGESDLHVSFGRGSMSAKLIQGKYPDYRWVVSQQVNSKVTMKRSDMIAAVKAASLMTDKETSTIVFHFEDNNCCLTTQAANIGESKIQVPVDLQGEAVQICFNPNYFIDAMRCFSDEEVRMELADGEKPGALRGGQGYRHLIMPLVTEKAAKKTD